MKKNPEKAIENYDDLRAFENRCLMPESQSVLPDVKLKTAKLFKKAK